MNLKSEKFITFETGGSIALVKSLSCIS